LARNIVLLSDGTGNSSAKQFKTNVWRLFQALDLRNSTKQVAYYDNGVGTSSFKPLALIGEVFGFGLKRNVIDIYSFCCRNYTAGDRIFCFGFSRGAFTIRVVAGLIARQGLVSRDHTDEDLARYAADAYRAYRRRFNITGGLVTPLRDLRDLVIRGWRALWRVPNNDPKPKVEVDSIHFVGLWDTVDAYGGPIEEMTRAIDYWIWPLTMPDQFMNAKIHKACHALALEDERDAFRPVIWDQRYVRGKDENYHGVNNRHPKKTEWLFDINYHAPGTSGLPPEKPPHQRTDLPAIDQQRISQVWFTGVHADIGGGYPQDGLSFVTLDWMMDRATPYGLELLDTQRRLLIDPQINPYDKLNDSRAGIAGYYRYKPRNIFEIYHAPPYKPSIRRDILHIWELLTHRPAQQKEIEADLHSSVASGGVRSPPDPTVHAAVFDRIALGNDRYAPVVMPAAYVLTDKAGAVTSGRSAVDPGPIRSAIQDDAWNWIWLRRVVYFLTVFASLFVAMVPYLATYYPGFGLSAVGGFVIPIVNTAASFLPNFLKPWFDGFRGAPGFFLLGAIAVAGLLSAGGYLQQKIRDVMRVGWQPPAGYIPRDRPLWQQFVYWLRRCGSYRAFFYVLKNWIFPSGIVIWLFLWFAFGTANTLGLFCKGEGITEVSETEVIGKTSQSAPDDAFHTSNICYATGLKVTKDKTYQIKLTVKEPWLDRTIPTDPTGFSGVKSAGQVAGLPYRRLVWSNWFAPIVRVGSSGLEEHLPEFKSQGQGVWTATFVPRSDGHVFLYVNDTSIFFPWLFTTFYDNNKGSAIVTLKKM